MPQLLLNFNTINLAKNLGLVISGSSMGGATHIGTAIKMTFLISEYKSNS